MHVNLFGIYGPASNVQKYVLLDIMVSTFTIATQFANLKPQGNMHGFKKGVVVWVIGKVRAQ